MHRPVPQVDAVRAPPQPHQRRPPQGPAHEPRRTGRHGQRGGGQAYAHQAAPVQEGAGAADECRGQGEPRQTRGAQRVDGPYVPGAPQRPGAGQRERQGDGGAEQQAAAVGVGAVVHPGGVRAGRVEDRHRHERGGGQGEGAHGLQPLPPQHGHQGPQQQRPAQVELLLDGERPQVLEHGQGQAVELREVHIVLRQLPPVAAVGEGGGDRPAQAAVCLAAGQCGRAGGHREHEPQQGEQPQGAAFPEGAEPDPAGSPVVGGEQTGDQVAADDEEEIDSEEAARQPRRMHVIDDDARHGQCPQSVQAPGTPEVRSHRSTVGPGGARRIRACADCRTPDGGATRSGDAPFARERSRIAAAAPTVGYDGPSSAVGPAVAEGQQAQ